MKVLTLSLTLIGLVAFVCGEEPQRAGDDLCRPEAGAEASRRFAYELYAKAIQSNKGDGNVFLAPTTVASALAMVLAGAKGATKEQLIQGLMFRNTSEKFSEYDIPCLLRSYSDDLPQTSVLEKSKGNQITDFQNPLVLRSASKIFGDKGFKFDNNFVQKTKSYGARMQPLDFRGNPEESRRKMNRWVEMMTEDKIKDLFGEDSVGSDTQLAIASAIYFKGLWNIPFDPKSTRVGNFYVNDTRSVEAEFMIKKDKFNHMYSYDLRAQLLELSYQADAFGRYNVSMILMLPMNTMEELEAKLTEKDLAPEIAMLLAQNAHITHVTLPKFKMTAKYDLKPILNNMGISDMFMAGLADLSGMRDPTSSDKRPLYVDSAVHKTFIEVDEKGTEAAGATGLTIVPLSLPPRFICDRPFIMMIYEKISQSVLFIGKMTDPTQ